MKKIFIVTSFLVISALVFAPTAKAFSINLNGIPGFLFHQEKDKETENDEIEKCKEKFHDDSVEEEHESETAKLHENDDNKFEDCINSITNPTPSPTPTVTSTPTATPDITATPTPVASPTGTSTPTPTPTGLIETSVLNDLINQLKLLIETLRNSLRD